MSFISKHGAARAALRAVLLAGGAGSIVPALPAPSAAAAAVAVADEAADHYQSLVGLCERELWDIAVREAREFLARWPGHALAVHARYRMATALLAAAEDGAAGDAARSEAARGEAIGLLRAAAAAEGFEFAAEAAMRLGQAELARGELDAAAQAFDRALVHGKDYLALPATALLAETEFRRGRFAEAEARYGELLDLAQRSRGEDARAREARLGLAWCALERGDARAAAERAAALARERAAGEEARAASWEAHYVLGEALSALGQPRDARAAFEHVAGGPYVEAALRGAAFAAADVGDRRAAIGLFGALVERFPQGSHAREAALQQGALLVAEGEPRAALAALDSPAAGDPPSAAVHVWRARALAAIASEADGAAAARSAREQALGALDAAAAGGALDSDADLAAEASALRGELLLALGRGAEARAALARAGSDAALQAAMASAVAGGDLAGAAELARELAGRFPDSTYAHEAALVIAEERFAAADWPAASRAFEALAAEERAPSELRRRALSRGAWCLYHQGQLQDAAQLFGQIAAAGPRDPLAEEARAMRTRALAEDAEALSAAGELDQAAARYRELLAALDSCGGAPAEAARARYGLAWCLAERDPRAASDLLAEAAAERGAPPETRLASLELLVWTAKSAGDARRAEDAWRSFARESSDPGRVVEALLAAAEAWKEAGDLRRALALLQSEVAHLARREDAGRALVAAALYAVEADEPAAAEESARLAARVVPGTDHAAEACYRAAEAWAGRGDWLRAGPLYEAAGAVASWPERADALYKCGFAALSSGNWAACEAALTALLDGTPEGERTNEALFCLAEAHYQQGELSAAVARLEQLGRRAPAPELAAKALFRLALADERLERWRECAAAAAALAAEHPDFSGRAEADLARGRALAQLGDAAAAREALTEVATSDRGRLGAAARIELAQLAAAAGERESALAEVLRVPVLYASPDEVAQALSLAAGWLDELGRRDQAIATWRELAREHPEHPLAAAAAERLRALGAATPTARAR